MITTHQPEQAADTSSHIALKPKAKVLQSRGFCSLPSWRTAKNIPLCC